MPSRQSRDQEPTAVNNVRRIARRQAAFGCGIVAGIVLCTAAHHWQIHWPSRPDRWDKRAVTAIPGDMFISAGNDLVLELDYTLTNNTPQDYYLPDNDSLFIRPTDGTGLIQAEGLSWISGNYLPPGVAVRIAASLVLNDQDSVPTDMRRDPEALGNYVEERMRWIDGIVILDREHRLQVDLPVIHRLRVSKEGER